MSPNPTVETLLQLESGEEIAKKILNSYVNKKPIISLFDTQEIVNRLDGKQKKLFIEYMSLWTNFRNFYPELIVAIVETERDLMLNRELLKETWFYYDKEPESLSIKEEATCIVDKKTYQEASFTEKISKRLRSNKLNTEYILGMYDGIKFLSQKIRIPLHQLIYPSVNSLKEFTIPLFNSTIYIMTIKYPNKKFSKQYGHIKGIDIESYKGNPELHKILQLLEATNPFKINIINEMKNIYLNKYRSAYNQ